MTSPASDGLRRFELMVVTVQGLRLRETPSIVGRVLTTLARGSKVRRMEVSRDGLWTRIEQPFSGGGRTGWMSSKYLGPSDHLAAGSGMRDEPWMHAAIHELGVAEVVGAGSSPRVLMYLESTELDHALASTDETPWCSAFVNWCMEVSGFVGTNSAAARSWLGWGQAIPTPRRGAVTVLRRDGGGHVGLWVSQSSSRVKLLGGNQGNQVCVAEYDIARVLGHRVPV